MEKVLGYSDHSLELSAEKLKVAEQMFQNGDVRITDNTAEGSRLPCMNGCGNPGSKLAVIDQASDDITTPAAAIRCCEEKECQTWASWRAVATALGFTIPQADELLRIELKQSSKEEKNYVNC